MLEFIIIIAAVFFVTVIAERIIIPILASHKVGQKILEIGPRWHKNKEGTPTMGGLCFILAILIVLAAMAVITAFTGETSRLIPLALTLCLAVFNGIIGFVDDYCKLVKKQNEGLAAYQKFLLQLLAAVAYIYIMELTGSLSTELRIPFTDISFELGWGYYPLAVLIITGIVNSVNLTDGIDGLASSVVLVIGIFFALSAFILFPDVVISLSYASAAIIGATLGFLVYNFHPARVFMGDTGSLFLGGMIVGMAFMCNEPLIILIAGFVPVFEAISVMLQVTYFKLTHGKRIFLMTPIHHHFEKLGWGEVKIVSIFSVVTAICCVIAWLAL